MIKVKNISTAHVYIKSDNFRRDLMPGREIPLKRSEYEDLMFDPGFNNLLTAHYLAISGVNDDDAVALQTGEIYDVEKIAKMFDEKDYTQFAKFLPTSTAAEKDTVIKIATEKGITDNGFTALIKKYCNVDIVSAINFKHLAEEK